MAGVYLKAAEIVETLDEYAGKKGRFIKTFGLNDQRNKNGWRALYDGIVKNIHTAKDRPGIEFMKCTADGCDLDHTEAQTKEASLEVQEPYRKTNIIDYPIDEASRTAFLIHEVLDDQLWDDVKTGKIKFVSPSIWPKSGGYEVIGTMENGLPMIDVWDWDFLHDAFVNKPAFGDDAKITAACEGQGCPVKLLSAKSFEYQADYEAKNGILDQGDITHLQEIPLSIMHNKKRTFMTVTKTAYDAIQALLKAGEVVDESKVFDIIRQEKSHSSFSSCTCSGIHMPTEEEELKSKLKATEEREEELKSKFKAQEEEEKKDMGARKARLVAHLRAMENEDEMKAHIASVKANTDDPKEAKAMEEAEKEVKTAKGNTTDDPTKMANEHEEKLNARIIELEQHEAEPLVAKMVKARQLKGADEKALTAFTKDMENKSLKDIKSLYANEAILIESLVASEPVEEPRHFAFLGSETNSPLHGKSLDEIFEEVAPNAS